MRDLVFLRNGSWPYQRVGCLRTAADIDRSYHLMEGGQAAFTLSPTDPLVAQVQRGVMVEINRYASKPVSLPKNDRVTRTPCRTYITIAVTWAQAFRTPRYGRTGSLASIEVPLRKVGSPTGTISFELWSADATGQPDAQVVAFEEELDVTTLTTSEAWYTFTLETAQALNRDTAYFLFLNISGLVTHDLNNRVEWLATWGGGSYGSVDGGDTWLANSPSCAKFRLNGDWPDPQPMRILPVWIGWIERAQYDHAAGIVEVDCIDVAAKLAERHSGLVSSRTGAAGLIARELLYQANARSAFGVTWDPTSEAGTPVKEIDVSGMSLLDALNRLAEVSGDEWWVRADASDTSLELHLHWGAQRGFDYRQSVYLREGREISSYSYGQDALPQAESVLVIGGGGAIEDRPAVVRAANAGRVSDPVDLVQSATELHRRNTPLPPVLASEKLVISPRDTDLASLSSLAQTELEAPHDALERISLSVNSRADWRRLDVGNIVRAQLGSIPWGDVDRPLRIREMQPGDADMMIEAEVLVDA